MKNEMLKNPYLTPENPKRRSKKAETAQAKANKTYKIAKVYFHSPDNHLEHPPLEKSFNPEINFQHRIEPSQMLFPKVDKVKSSHDQLENEAFDANCQKFYEEIEKVRASDNLKQGIDDNNWQFQAFSEMGNKFNVCKLVNPLDVEYPKFTPLNLHNSYAQKPTIATSFEYNLFNNIVRNLATTHPSLILRLFKNPQMDTLRTSSLELYLENSWKCITLNKEEISSYIQANSKQYGNYRPRKMEPNWPNILLKAIRKYEDKCNRKMFSDEEIKDIRVCKTRTGDILTTLTGGVINSYWLDLKNEELRCKMKKIINARGAERLKKKSMVDFEVNTFQNSPNKPNSSRYKNKMRSPESSQDTDSINLFGFEGESLRLELENEIWMEIANALSNQTNYILMAGTRYFERSSGTVLYPIIGIEKSRRILELADPLSLCSDFSESQNGRFHITLARLIEHFDFLVICEVSEYNMYSSIGLQFHCRNNVKYCINYTQAYTRNPMSVQNIPPPINESNLSLCKFRIDRAGVYTVRFQSPKYLVQSPTDEFLKSPSLRTSSTLTLCFIDENSGVKFVDTKSQSNKPVIMKGYFTQGEYVLLVESYFRQESFQYLIKATKQNFDKESSTETEQLNYGNVTLVGDASVPIKELELEYNSKENLERYYGYFEQRAWRNFIEMTERSKNGQRGEKKIYEGFRNPESQSRSLLNDILHPYPPEIVKLDYNLGQEITLEAIKGTFSVDEAWNMRPEHRQEFMKQIYNLIPASPANDPYNHAIELSKDDKVKEEAPVEEKIEEVDSCDDNDWISVGSGNQSSEQPLKNSPTFGQESLDKLVENNVMPIGQLNNFNAKQNNSPKKPLKMKPVKTKTKSLPKPRFQQKKYTKQEQIFMKQPKEIKLNLTTYQTKSGILLLSLENSNYFGITAEHYTIKQTELANSQITIPTGERLRLNSFRFNINKHQKELILVRSFQSRKNAVKWVMSGWKNAEKLRFDKHGEQQFYEMYFKVYNMNLARNLNQMEMDLNEIKYGVDLDRRASYTMDF